MHRALSVICLSIALTAQTGRPPAFTAQPAPKEPPIDSRVSRGYRSILASDLRADLTFLASEALEGRMSLQRGSEAAIQFIAAEFAKAGVKPAMMTSAGPSYFQD